jgi:hypothetical protein
MFLKIITTPFYHQANSSLLSPFVIGYLAVYLYGFSKPPIHTPPIEKIQACRFMDGDKIEIWPSWLFLAICLAICLRAILK